MSLLDVRDLSITFTSRGRRPVRAVDGLSLNVDPGQSIGLVGESGCGKSITSLAILGLLPKRGVEITGEIEFEGRDLLAMRDSDLRDIRGRDIAMIFQDPMSSLNPVVTIGVQITEVLRRHRGMTSGEAKAEAEQILRRVEIPDPARRLGEYPHQLSGGMRQRVLIGIALACKPKLLIADEPTTALDVTIQAQILELLKQLSAETDSALIMITHDLGVVAGLCDEVNVMYAGRLVESADRYGLFREPQHRYTQGLLAATPRLDQPRDQRLNPIEGSAQDSIPWSQGCAFAPRCRHQVEACIGGAPSLVEFGSAHQHRCVNPVSDDTSRAAAARNEAAR